MVNLELFKQLDKALRGLAMSDSSVGHASHIRKQFDLVLEGLNELKRAENTKVFDDVCYFDSDLDIDYSDIL